ncbi:OmpP1/FadL family transporter [Flavobacterium sp.]|uniref:OmpP1/FadL family transporter n=1 Tax=Flavobacterium sp. TaxID=239 RepID=UPI0038FC0B27
MKKYISLFVITLCFSGIQAQDASDAYRYSQDNISGTARFRAMSGAFGALGGDLSAINLNPAGSVVFANNQIAFSGSNFNTKNKSNYFGKQTSESNNSLDLNQAGAVFVFENNHENNDWKKFSIAINYENTNNFDNSLFSAGTNNNSIDNYFLNNANGLKLSIVNGTDYYYDELTFREQQAYLGYKAFVINESATYNDVTNRSYISLVAPGGNYYQTNSTEATGYNGKVTFNAATQYKDILMLGINLNTHFIDYKRSNRFTESNNNNTSAINDLVNRIAFNNDLYTYGSGFSLQLGAIVKPIKEIRLGLAYQSPTWYKLTDELTQSLSAISGNTAGNLPEDVANPNLTIIYPAYKLQNPSKLTGSFAYIFGKRGLISFDYSLKNYSNLAFSPKNDDYFQSINNSLSKYSREHASEYSIGGEYKIKQFSLRGGYHFEQSPYKNATTIGNLTSYSGGIGYNFGNTKLDLAYSNSKRDSNQQFFNQGLTDAAKINTIKNNVTLTLAFEL